MSTTLSASGWIARAARFTTSSTRVPASRRAYLSTPRLAVSPFAYRIATTTTVSKKWISSRPRLPTWPTNQRTTPRANAETGADISSGPAAASRCQRATSRVPITGSSAIHPGGWGRVSVANDSDHVEICLAFSTIAVTPK